MRLALVSQEYPPETAHGGIGSQTYLKAHGLTGLGHDVWVISHSVDAQRHETHDGLVSVIRIPGIDHRMTLATQSARWIAYSVEVAVELAALHSRVGLDLIDVPEWGAEGYVHLANQAAWNHVPTVVHLHGPLVMFAHTLGWPAIDSDEYRIGTQLEGVCVRLADQVFSSSACSADWVARHYGIARERIPVLHAGIDTRLFAPCAVPKDERPTIIFVGKIARNKGVELLIDAACRLQRELPRLKLQMLGGGELRYVEELRTRALAVGSNDLLEMPGFIRREALPMQLSRAHVFAAPSVYEGGPGFVYLEAMACGLPVIACEGSGATETLRHGENGWVIPPEDVEALIKALRELLTNALRRNALGDCARRYVLEHAETKRCVKQLEAFYAEVAARPSTLPRGPRLPSASLGFAERRAPRGERAKPRVPRGCHAR